MRLLRYVALIAAGLAFVSAPSRAAPVACNGSNLWPVLETRHPGLAREIDERARRMPFGEGRLFRISKPGKPVSYVLGTIHVYDRRFIPLSPGIVTALSETHMTALELKDVTNISLLDFEGGDVSGAVRQLMAESGQRPIDFLDETEKKLVLETGGTSEIPGPLMLTLRPALLAEWLSSGYCSRPAWESGEPGVDEEIARLSRADHKPVIGLETLEEQLATVTGVPFEVQKEMLRASLRTLKTGPDLFETIIQQYIEGRLGRVVMLVYGDIAQIRAEYGVFPMEYNKVLIDDRNRRMRDRALPHLDINSVFIAVGAAHLPGERGLLKLLEEAGYRVEKVE